MSLRNASAGRAAVAQVRRLLPRGHTLPPEELRRRHRALLILLWLHAVLVPLWAVSRGFGIGHSLVEGDAIAVCAIAATVVGARRSGGPLLVSLGLLTSSAVIVHLSGGVIEAHFHFFVVIVLLTLYEDWMIFLLAAAFVVVHHGIGGELDPHAVFNHPDAEAHPWRWALVHAAYVGAAGLGAIVTWRLNEDLRDQHVRLIADKQAALERAEAAERELERYARELERSNRELDEFASIASHDLSAPLLTVSGFLTLLEERYAGRLDPEADEFIAHAVGGSWRMQRLITNLLEYSRVGRAGLAPEDVDLAAVAREAIVGLRGPIEEAGAEIVVDPLPVVRAQPHELTRLVQNLVANAIKHHDRASGLVVVSASQAGDATVVEVRDDGPGIPSEHHSRVFKMFQTLRPRDERGGSGMGLAVVKKVLEAHGARVELHSAGRGTTMKTFWPRSKELAT